METNQIEIFSALTENIPQIDIDPGIEKLVGILNSKGLVTEMSCAGHATERSMSRAWVQIEAAHFKGYMARNPEKMEAFLLAGEGMWSLDIEYSAKSVFKGLGSARPRLCSLKRALHIDMAVKIRLCSSACEGTLKKKVRIMKSIERAAESLL